MAESQNSVLKNRLEPAIISAQSELEEIWDAIGVCLDERNRRLVVAEEHVTTLLGEMVAEEKALLAKLLERIESFSVAIIQMNDELSLPVFTPTDGLTIRQREQELHKKVEDLTNMKYKRIKRLKKLKAENVTLCQSMNAEPFFVPPNMVPSEDFLAQVETHTKALLTEKDTRLKTYYATKNAVLELYRELGREPTSEEKALYNDEDFVLSLDALDRLTNLQDELKQENQDQVNQVIILRENLAKLWDTLKIEQNERDKFLAKYPGHKPSTMKALKEKICEMKHLLQQNIKKYVHSLRQDLVGLWDKCYFGPEQRDIFRAFHDDSYNEELLELHNLEIDKLKSYFEENKELLYKFSRREQLWEKMLELEKKATDPNRFNNRGGNLLQEEKERKKLQKELPKLENELINLAINWEEKHGKVFMINGQRLVEYMEEQITAYKQDKENEKAERQRAKAKQIEEEVLKGTTKLMTPTMKRKIETPKSSRKRINDGPLSQSRSFRVHSSIASYHTPGRHLPRSAKARGRVAVLNRSKKRRSRTAPGGIALRRSGNKNNFADVFNQSVLSETVCANNTTAVSIASTVASYGDFSNQLQVRDQGIFNSTTIRNPTLSTPNMADEMRIPSMLQF